MSLNKIVDLLPTAPNNVDQKALVNIDKSFQKTTKFLLSISDEVESALKLDETDPENTKSIKATRLKLVKVRTATDKIHKDEKAKYQPIPKYIDATRKVLKDGLISTEAALKEKEDYLVVQEAKKKQKLEEDRRKALGEVLEQGADMPSGLADMSEEIFAMVLKGAVQDRALKQLEAENRAKIVAEQEAIQAKLKSRWGDLQPYWHLVGDKLKAEWKDLSHNQFMEELHLLAKSFSELKEAKAKEDQIRIDEEVAKRLAEKESVFERAAKIPSLEVGSDAEKLVDIIDQLNAISQGYTFHDVEYIELYGKACEWLASFIRRLEEVASKIGK